MLATSIVIPVHNEAENISAFVRQFVQDTKNLPVKIHEILLMENGSTDATPEKCRQLETELPHLIKAIEISEPSYGEAIKQGMLKAEAETVTILECDVLDAGFVQQALELLALAKADFVVASKRHPDSVDNRPFKRRLLTFLFNFYLKLFFSFPGTDTHGLKAIRTPVAQHLCKEAITGGEIFQAEIVLLAHQFNYNVQEVPLRLEEKRAAPVSVARRLPKVINIIRELKRSMRRFK